MNERDYDSYQKYTFRSFIILRAISHEEKAIDFSRPQNAPDWHYSQEYFSVCFTPSGKVKRRYK